MLKEFLICIWFFVVSALIAEFAKARAAKTGLAGWTRVAFVAEFAASIPMTLMVIMTCVNILRIYQGYPTW